MITAEEARNLFLNERLNKALSDIEKNIIKLAPESTSFTYFLVETRLYDDIISELNKIGYEIKSEYSPGLYYRIEISWAEKPQ